MRSDDDRIAAGIIAHLVGDYLLQSHWMATEKTARWLPAVVHGVAYAVPFVVLTRSLRALVLIGASHVVIDRYRLARHVVWAKNQLAPDGYRPGHTATGYPEATPQWLAVWLLILCDNTLHVLINSAVLMLCDAKVEVVTE